MVRALDSASIEEDVATHLQSWSDWMNDSFVPSLMNVPWDDVTLVLIALIGLSVALLGHRLSRIFCFISGFIFGACIIDHIFLAEASVRHTTLPIVVLLLMATVLGVGLLLLHSVTLAAALGYVVATGIWGIDHGKYLGWGIGPSIIMACCIIAALILGKKSFPWLIVLSTSFLGSMMSVMAIDHLADKTLSSVLFDETFWRPFVGVADAVPHCSKICSILLVVWVFLTCLGILVQCISIQLDRTRIVTQRKHVQDDSIFAYNTFGSQELLHPSGSFQSISSKDTKAAYNMFDPLRLPENLQPIYPILQTTFEALQQQFGFQLDNTANQCEHLLFLIGNYRSHNYADAISRLHARIFSNYLQWTDYLHQRAYISNIQDSCATMKIYEMALWLCIWGEAASLRHLPECLCYIYHYAGAELRACRNPDGKVKVGRTIPARKVGSYLTDVVTPIYDILKSEKGDAYTVFRNYDDINEFFWQPKCLRYYFANPRYYVDIHGLEGIEANRPGESPSPFTLPPSVSVALKSGSKTYLERRSWLHAMRTFMRLITFFFVGFHLLVALAYIDSQHILWLSPSANRILSSFVISLAGWSVVKELFEIWATYGIIMNSMLSTVGFIIRLSIKSVIFSYLLLFYIWTNERTTDYYDAFSVCAFIYLTPYLINLIGQVFPSLSSATRSTHRFPVLTSLLRFWYPSSRQYVGRECHEPATATHQFQLFWLILLTMKFYCSYLFQVRPLIEPTFHILNAPLVWSHIWQYNNISHAISIFLLWSPFVLVFLFDTIIWYFMAQAVVGVAVGMKDHLGEIRNFNSLIQAFTQLPAHFDAKLLGNRSKEPQSEQLSPVPDPDGNEETHSLLRRHRAAYDEETSSKDVFRSSTWQNFATAWNEIVEHLRKEDLLDNSEKNLLVFRFLKHSEKELYIPLLLVAGVVEHAIEKIQQQAPAFKQTSNVNKKEKIKKSLVNSLTTPIRKEGMLELWENIRWILSNLLGDLHENTLQEVYEHITVIFSDGTGDFLKVINPDGLPKVKGSLLNLVRGLRIASASFESAAKNRSRRGDSFHQQRNNHDEEREGGHTSEYESDDEKEGVSVGQHKLQTPNPTLLGVNTKLSLKGILKSPSVGTLSILDTIRTQPRYQVPEGEDGNEREGMIAVHVNLIRDQLSQFLHSISSVFSSSGIADKPGLSIGSRIKHILVDHHGFMFDSTYAERRLESLLKQSQCSTRLASLHAVLTVAQIDAEPRNLEATRRLLFFANSLFMNIPSASAIHSMKSWTTLTPFHSEDVIYGFSDLEKSTEDGVSVFFYLQTVFPNEWSNFIQRLGISDDRVATILHSKKEMEARQWATNRGQTLGRTVDGMMLYEKALRLLAKLEQPSAYDVEIEEIIRQKFQYIISCQLYGKQKREMDQKAADIDYLLHRYPNLRVAYIDQNKVLKHDGQGKATVVEEFYSVLVKGEKDGSVKEVYRVKIPGNPILGEGKPENQNHAIIFTRGEYVQTIDMNQSNSFEEALKMRNLLEEFDSNDDDAYEGEGISMPGSSVLNGNKHIGIVGFREHIYTG